MHAERENVLLPRSPALANKENRRIKEQIRKASPTDIIWWIRFHGLTHRGLRLPTGRRYWICACAICGDNKCSDNIASLYSIAVPRPRCSGHGAPAAVPRGGSFCIQSTRNPQRAQCLFLFLFLSLSLSLCRSVALSLSLSLSPSPSLSFFLSLSLYPSPALCVSLVFSRSLCLSRLLPLSESLWKFNCFLLRWQTANPRRVNCMSWVRAKIMSFLPAHLLHFTRTVWNRSTRAHFSPKPTHRTFIATGDHCKIIGKTMQWL